MLLKQENKGLRKHLYQTSHWWSMHLCFYVNSILSFLSLHKQEKKNTKKWFLNKVFQVPMKMQLKI